MKINSEVYGTEEIKEPVLIELINSKAIQRLKEISQYGMPSEYYHKKSPFTRYDHSIGVLILLRRLNAALQEQIAGLLHDVSHTAFSHVIDWIIGDPEKEDFQDKTHLKILNNSNIPKILSKYSINYEEVSNNKNFTLLDKELPSLCADRIDYAIQELKRESNYNIERFLNNLLNYKGQIVFKSKEVAEDFAEKFSTLQKEHWAGDQAKARYFILAGILKKALEKNIITLNDFNKTDKEVIDILIKSSDKEMLNGLKLLRNGFKIKPSFDGSGVILKKKFRYIDPEILKGENINKLSEISFDYKIFLESEKQNSNRDLRVNIVGLK